MAWLIFIAVIVGVAIGAALIFGFRSAIGSIGASGQPTPNEAKAEARAAAQEVMHAPDSDVARRVDELRKRGRTGK